MSGGRIVRAGGRRSVASAGKAAIAGAGDCDCCEQTCRVPASYTVTFHDPLGDFCLPEAPGGSGNRRAMMVRFGLSSWTAPRTLTQTAADTYIHTMDIAVQELVDGRCDSAIFRTRAGTIVTEIKLPPLPPGTPSSVQMRVYLACSGIFSGQFDLGYASLGECGTSFASLPFDGIAIEDTTFSVVASAALSGYVWNGCCVPCGCWGSGSVPARVIVAVSGISVVPGTNGGTACCPPGVIACAGGGSDGGYSGVLNPTFIIPLRVVSASSCSGCAWGPSLKLKCDDYSNTIWLPDWNPGDGCSVPCLSGALWRRYWDIYRWHASATLTKVSANLVTLSVAVGRKHWQYGTVGGCNVAGLCPCSNDDAYTLDYSSGLTCDGGTSGAGTTPNTNCGSPLSLSFAVAAPAYWCTDAGYSAVNGTGLAYVEYA